MTLRMILGFGAGLLVVTLGTGCALNQNTDAFVESDTSWSGSFEGRTIDGRGDQTIRLGNGPGIKCASVQKETVAGFLTLRIDGGEERTTTAAYGVVTVCGESAF